MSLIESITWLQPLWLIASALLILLAALWRYPSLNDHWHRVMSHKVLAYLGVRKSRLHNWDLLLLMAAIVCAALAQPSLRLTSDDTWRHSIGWIAVADVSRSMTLNDTVPSRLSAARNSLLALSASAGARPIAMIVFAGDAYLVAPPAFDRSHFNEHAALLEHGIIPNEGSNLARALSLASSVIEESEFQQARVFVVGDSGGINPSSEAAARHLASSGHRTDVIVFGDTTANLNKPNESTSITAAGSLVDLASQAPDNTFVNLEASRSFASAGGGTVVQANSFGVIDYEPLKLHRGTDASNVSTLRSLVWKNQSHWLLLLVLPLMLYWFWRYQEGEA